MKRPRSILRIVLGAILCAPALTPAAADTLVVSPVAVQGAVAPEGGRYLLFGEVDVDPIRRITLTASLSGGQVGIFRTFFGELQPVVLSGDPAPPDAGNRFSVPLDVAGNTRGDLAFISTLAFPDRAGLFLMSGGAIRTLALEGTPFPGSADRRLGGFAQVRLLESGEVMAIADVLDAAGEIIGRAVLAHDGSALRAMMAPGDRYGGTRSIGSVIQYDVNEAGDVAALVEVLDADLLAPAPLSEIVLLSEGRLRTLASAFLSLDGGTDQVRHFAVSDDQVHLDAGGGVSFFAATNNFVAGGYALNTSGRLSDSPWLAHQGDASPHSSSDKYAAFGAFGRTADGLLVFHAITTQAPGGLLAVRPPQGADLIAAQAGTPRPGGGTWSGFRRIGMNASGAFVFTDFQVLLQVGVFLGRLVPPPARILDDLAARLEDPDLAPGDAHSLSGLLRPLDRAVRQGDTGRALLLAAAMRRELAVRGGQSLPLVLAETLDVLLDDLMQALSAEASGN